MDNKFKDYSFEDAFKELDDISDLEAEEEKTKFKLDDIDDIDDLKGLLNSEDDDEDDEYQMIIDLDAEEDEEAKIENGDIILQCKNCLSLIGIDEEDLVKAEQPEDDDDDEEKEDVYNIDLVCPHCHKTAGYELRGECAPYNKEESEKLKDGDITNDVVDIEGDDIAAAEASFDDDITLDDEIVGDIEEEPKEEEAPAEDKKDEKKTEKDFKFREALQRRKERQKKLKESRIRRLHEAKENKKEDGDKIQVGTTSEGKPIELCTKCGKYVTKDEKGKKIKADTPEELKKKIGEACTGKDCEKKEAFHGNKSGKPKKLVDYKAKETVTENAIASIAYSMKMADKFIESHPNFKDLSEKELSDEVFKLLVSDDKANGANDNEWAKIWTPYVIDSIKFKSKETVTDEKDSDSKVESLYSKVSFDKIDESLFNDAVTQYLHEEYENAAGFEYASHKVENGKIVVEGIIKFKSGRIKDTEFIFEAVGIDKKNRIKLVGINETFTNYSKPYTVIGHMDNNAFITESLNYNYKVKGLNEQFKNVYGTVKVEAPTKLIEKVVEEAKEIKEADVEETVDRDSEFADVIAELVDACNEVFPESEIDENDIMFDDSRSWSLYINGTRLNLPVNKFGAYRNYLGGGMYGPICSNGREEDDTVELGNLFADKLSAIEEIINCDTDEFPMDEEPVEAPEETKVDLITDAPAKEEALEEADKKVKKYNYDRVMDAICNAYGDDNVVMNGGEFDDFAENCLVINTTDEPRKKKGHDFAEAKRIADEYGLKTKESEYRRSKVKCLLVALPDDTDESLTEAYYYVVHSDVDENNVYAEFDSREEAIKYAKDNAVDQTWVDEVDDATHKHETIWVYDDTDEALTEDISEIKITTDDGEDVVVNASAKEVEVKQEEAGKINIEIETSGNDGMMSIDMDDQIVPDDIAAGEIEDEFGNFADAEPGEQMIAPTDAGEDDDFFGDEDAIVDDATAADEIESEFAPNEDEFSLEPLNPEEQPTEEPVEAEEEPEEEEEEK